MFNVSFSYLTDFFLSCHLIIFVHNQHINAVLPY